MIREVHDPQRRDGRQEDDLRHDPTLAPWSQGRQSRSHSSVPGPGSAEVQRQSLWRTHDLQAFSRSRCLCDHPVQGDIVPTRVVMEQSESSDAHRGGQRDGMLARAMAPADPLLVLDIEILSVMDQEVGAVREFRSRQPSRVVQGPAHAQGGFMIGQVGEGRPTVIDAIPEGGAGMDHKAGGDR